MNIELNSQHEQGISSQVLVSVSSSAEQWDNSGKNGTDVSHSRSLVAVPLSQVTEQAFHGPQAIQWVCKSIIIFNKFICFCPNPLKLITKKR